MTLRPGRLSSFIQASFSTPTSATKSTRPTTGLRFLKASPRPLTPCCELGGDPRCGGKAILGVGARREEGRRRAGRGRAGKASSSGCHGNRVQATRPEAALGGARRLAPFPGWGSREPPAGPRARRLERGPVAGFAPHSPVLAVTTSRAPATTWAAAARPIRARVSLQGCLCSPRGRASSGFKQRELPQGPLM